jgi:hypothetical protein
LAPISKPSRHTTRQLRRGCSASATTSVNSFGISMISEWSRTPSSDMFTIRQSRDAPDISTWMRA